jgi:DNA-binding MarR family transcriptional regulator
VTDVTDLRELFHQLIRFETELWDGIDRRLRAGHGLPMGTFDTMRVIERVPGCRVQDIAAELAITVGAASKVVDRIEAAGHCARRANPGDRRSSLVELTPAGAELLAAAGVTFDAELRLRLGDALPDRTLRELTGTLVRLRAAGARTDAGRST